MEASLNRGAQIVREAWSAIRPPRAMSVTEWAEKNRILDGGESALPGAFRVRLTPYLREIMDCFSVDSPILEGVMMKGSQVGGSLAASNIIGYLMDYGRGSILVVEPNTDLAKRYSETNIGPMIASSECLRGKVHEVRSRDSGNTTLRKRFAGGTLYLVGANSAAGLRQVSGPWLIVDEVDALPRSIPGEGDPVALAERASKTFPRHKRLYISTPTIQGRSRIEKKFLETDQRTYFVPCSKCNAMQVLVFKDPTTGRFGLRWEGDLETGLDVWYECEKCQEKIREWQKPAMFEAGEWRAKVPALSDRFRGWHISSLYAAPGTYTWKNVAEEFLRKKSDPEQLRVFVNQWLGETFQERGDAPPWQELFRRREQYPIGIVPARAAVLTAGVDVQRDRIEATIRAWGENLENWTVEHFVFENSITSTKAQRDLDRLLFQDFKHAKGGSLRIRGMAIDSSDQTQEVYSWGRRHPIDLVYCIKGSDSQFALVGQPSFVDFDRKGKRIARGVRLWHLGVSSGKREFYSWLRIPPPLDITKDEAIPRFCHFPKLEEEWFKQLTAEELVPIRRGRDLVYRWQKQHERNEALDCAIYSRAAAYILGLDRWGPSDWKRELDAIGAAPAAPAAIVHPRSRPRGEGQFKAWRDSRRRNAMP